MRLTIPIAMKAAHTQIAAASALPMKMLVRDDDRVRIVFQVPCRSSPAKISPANSPASSGAAYRLASFSRVSDVANPVVEDQRPNSVSEGPDGHCDFVNTAKTMGATTHRASTIRSGHWVVSFPSSTLVAAHRPGRRPAPAAWTSGSGECGAGGGGA